MMARMVTITISYDMDDEEKSLGAELRDWLEGHVSVQDLGLSQENGWERSFEAAACSEDGETSITIRPKQG